MGEDASNTVCPHCGAEISASGFATVCRSCLNQLPQAPGSEPPAPPTPLMSPPTDPLRDTVASTQVTSVAQSRGQGSNTPRLTGIAALLALMVGIIAALAVRAPSPPQPRAGRDSGFSEWLDREAYQRAFEQNAARGWYPARAEGRAVGSELQFRGRFVPVPPGVQYWWACHGATPDEYAARGAGYKAQGATEVWRHSFRDGSGKEWCQATWLVLPAERGLAPATPSPGEKGASEARHGPGAG